MKRATANTLVPQGGIETTRTNGDGSASSIRSFRVSYEEAVRLVKRSQGREFSLHVQQWAYARDQADAREGSTLGRTVSSYVSGLSRRQVLGYMDNAYGARTRDECYVSIAFAERIFFVG